MSVEQLHFSNIGREQWLNKIEHDLKGQSIESLIDEELATLDILPFVHEKDVEAFGINRLRFHRSPSCIPMGMVAHHEVESANKAALKSLQNGAGSLLLLSIPETDFDAAVVGINLSIAPCYRFDSNQAGSQNLPLSLEVDLSMEGIAAIVRYMSRVATNQDSPPVIVKLGNHFYKNIAYLRALRIVHDQLVKDLSMDSSSLKILAQYTIDDHEDLAFNLQTSMPKVVSALLAGADHICSPHGCKESEQKWYHNLVHLLTLESKIPVNEDTLSGSFFIELLTNRFSDKIWAELVNDINK